MQKLQEKLGSNPEIREKFKSWLNSRLTQEVLQAVKDEGVPTLLPFNVVNKEASSYLLGLYAGWFGAIRMIETLGEHSVIRELTSEYKEDIV